MSDQAVDTDRECLRAGGRTPCRGPVSGRLSYGGTGTVIDECEAHLDESAQRNERHRRVYPDSPVAPSWFDPTYAGERWDDDY